MEHRLAFGPQIRAHAVTFRLWAPLVDRARVRIERRGEWDMRPLDGGWHVAEVAGARIGDRYKFVLPDGIAVPDPASRFQPDDVHGSSELVDPMFNWQAKSWKGRRWEEVVLYELHVGAFTEAGTFLAAIEKLDHLQRLGITAVQLMPLGDFRGRYGWGYDGVQLYAPDSSYGRPEHLKLFVDAAHERGICVILDVVYNHFGPDGNYLPLYAPIFSDRHESFWGKGLNYDGESSRHVRDFVIENAIYWLSEFRMDGLRLDAVHAIHDESDPHLLVELAERIERAFPERDIHLILENENNDSSLLNRDENARPRHFTAQWNDDIHHALHVAATGETFGYYEDYIGYRSRLARALVEGFAFQGEYMEYRGRARGSPSADLPPTAFVSFIQNHDQIGNRALGDRMTSSHAIEAIKAIAAIYLMAPQIPMLFMGEEWGASDPFPFFCDFDDELNRKVRIGRKEELKRLPGSDLQDTPDPTQEATFRSAKLHWEKMEQDQVFGDYYRHLIGLRHRHIVPLLESLRGHSAACDEIGPLMRVDWVANTERLHLLANLSSQTAVMATPVEGQVLFASTHIASSAIDPWTVVWSLSHIPGK